MKKVLVANRGEIARRVLRTLKKMDIKSVAVYSDADANSPHVLEADEAVYVGQSPSSESYLQQDKIIQICLDLGVDAVHPGYGFLSENAGFARKLTAAGIKLIGPSPESMEVMGDKLSAKQAVKVGVNRKCVPVNVKPYFPIVSLWYSTSTSQLPKPKVFSAKEIIAFSFDASKRWSLSSATHN